MATARSAWGIDLGNRALKAVKLVREGDGFRVDDFEIIEHEQILSVSGDNKESLLQAALASFVERHNVRKFPVAVGVSGQQSFARFIKLPPVEEKKIPEIVRFEAIQQIPFPLDDVEWSFQLFRPAETPEVEVGIFAMKKELVNRQISYFTSLGLNVQAVQMMPLAVYNAMYYDDRVGHTTMFMDSGAESTDLVIAEGDSVWLRTLPIGGNTFTEALAKAFKLNFLKAEELKRNAATSKYAKQIFQAMRPVFADLVSEIQRSIGFYASVHRDSRISRIVALGSTFQLPGLQKYLQQNLQLPVEKLDSFKANPPADAKLAASFQEGMISLAGAYGLALQAMGEGKITSSLLPATIRRQKMWQAKAPWFGLAAACFAVAPLVVFTSHYLTSYSYAQADSIRAENNKVKSLASQRAGQWLNDVQNKGEEDRAKLVNIRSLQEYRSTWSQILDDVSKATPTLTFEQQEKIERARREHITIDSIRSRYVPNLTTYIAGSADLPRLAETAFGASGGGGASPTFTPRAGAGFRPRGAVPEVPTPTPDAAAVEANHPRGFVLEIRGFTPYRSNNTDGQAFVNSKLVTGLLNHTLQAALKLGPGVKPYYIAKAELIDAGPRKAGMPNPAMADIEDPDALGAEADLNNPTAAAPVFSGGARPFIDRGPRGGFGQPRGGPMPRPWSPGPGVGPSGQPLPQIDPNQDRVFKKETIDKDTAFTVLAVIVLDPALPKPADGSTPTEGATAASQ